MAFTVCILERIRQLITQKLFVFCGSKDKSWLENLSVGILTNLLLHQSLNKQKPCAHGCTNYLKSEVSEVWIFIYPKTSQGEKHKEL